MLVFTRGLFAFALSLFIVGSPAVAANSIGKVVAVLGVPQASGPGGDRKLNAGSAVFEDDKITVGGSGNAQVLLNDGTKLVVGPSSTLLLDRFVMQGSAGRADSVGIKALRGTFRFITGKSKKSAYKISTSNATIGIRGTGFDFWTKNNSGVLVMEGSVVLNNNRGKSVLVRADCEMGRTSPSDARKLEGNVFAEAVRSNLPYVLNQRRLNRLFWLPIENCKPILTKYANPTGDQDSGDNEQNKRKNNNNNNNNNNRGGEEECNDC
jgi:hypothetical protein